MPRKDLIFYSIILILVLLLLWQWLSKGSLAVQLAELQKDSKDLRLLSGIGQLHSAHLHADVKVYINGNSIDFSQKKYQLAARYIHFEEGVGDVIHTHATGLTMGHLFKSLHGDFNNDCVVLEEADYCSEGSKKLKFYANGKLSNEYNNYEIKDLDKILVSYGTESEAQIQKQLNSITNLAPGISGKDK